LSGPPEVSVIIITRNRAPVLVRCLEHLSRQQQAGIPFETIVVDSSDGEETQKVLKQPGYQDIRKVRIPGGRDNMPEARNRGMSVAQGRIFAFIDDDSFVQEGWLPHIVRHYDDAGVGGVGGRLIDDRVPPEAIYDIVGRVDPDGRIHLNFQYDPGGPIPVDHFQGCNMSFRVEALRKTGGFDPNFAGPNFMEETDLCTRVRAAGYRLIFDPAAVVHHVNVPREGMGRSDDDPRVAYWGIRNRVYFTLKNFPLTFPRLRHVFLGSLKLHAVLFFKEPGWVRIRSACLHLLGMISGVLVYLFREKRGLRL
jgi:GT2 family glycosyltransferase